MLANKRLSVIVDKINQKGAVTVTELATEFGVSIETVRRDLLSLEKKNLLQRVHGGAVSVGEMIAYHDLATRMEENVEEKMQLGKIVKDIVCDGDVVYLDAGTTSVYLARELKNKDITVATCSLNAFNELLGGKVKPILCGGTFDPLLESFCGIFAEEIISKLYFSKAFILPSAISLKHGIFDFSYEDYPLQVKAMERCDKVYFAATSNKFEKNGLLKLCDTSTDYIYVTDSKLKKEYKEMYAENGMTIIDGKEENK